MTLLLENLQEVVQTEGDVDKLKSTILDLAMKGKLVEQDPNEESASVLLEQIKEKKKHLAEEKKIRKPKKIPEITSQEKPYTLPNGWKWVKLSDLALDIRGGGTPSKSKIEYWNGEIPWCSVKDMDDEMYLFNTKDKITRKATEESSTIIVPKNNLLVVTRMGLGKVKINRIDTAINQDLKAVFTSDYMNNKFVYYSLKKIKFVGKGATVKGITQNELQQSLIPLPPLREQHRIVNKIGYLFDLCDQLYEQFQQQNTSNATLNTTVFNRIQDANNPNQYQDLKFAVEHMDSLCQTEDDVQLLKQSLLDLAIQGKLVKQDPNDKPASVLLEQIEEEKNQLVKEKRIRKPKKLLEITEDEKLYDLPNGWVWTRLAQIFDVRDGTHDTPKYVTEGVPLVTSKNIYSGTLDLENTKKISHEDHIKINQRSKVEVYDILFAMIGSIGNPLLIKEEPHFSIKNVALFKHFNKDLTNPHYLLLYLQQAEEDMKRNSSGGVQSFLSLTYLRNYLIPLPPLKEQQRIVDQIDKLFRMCDQLIEQLQRKNAIQENFDMAAFNEVETNTNKVV